MSVIIPTYQRGSVLRYCLTAFLDQLREQDEIIVVVDGSTDETERVLREFQPPVQVLFQSNGGRSAAANRGLEAASREYVWVFDDDDIPLPGVLDRLALFLDDRSGLDFGIIPWQRAVRPVPGGPPTADGFVFQIPDLNRRGPLAPLFESNYIGGASMFARQRMYRESGVFDPRYLRSQDYHLNIRAALNCSFEVVCDEPGFLYTMHDSDRGPERERFTVDMIRRKWLQYDQMLYFDLLDGLAIDYFAEPNTRGDERLGLAMINKARTAASKHLPDACLESLIARCTRLENHALTSREIQAVHGMIEVGQWYETSSPLLEPAFLDSIRALRKHGRAGRQIAQQVLSAEKRARKRERRQRKKDTR